jgi:integrase
MASLMLANGAPAKVVQERLGHSSVMVTLDIYSHVAPRHAARRDRSAGASDRRLAG